MLLKIYIYKSSTIFNSSDTIQNNNVNSQDKGRNSSRSKRVMMNISFNYINNEIKKEQKKIVFNKIYFKFLIPPKSPPSPLWTLNSLFSRNNS